MAQGLCRSMNGLVSGIVDVGYIGWAMTVRINNGGGMIVANWLKYQMITPNPIVVAMERRFVAR